MRFSVRARLLSTVTAALVAVGLMVAVQPATADTAPPDASIPKTVADDVLPAPQIDGVVWAMVIAGNTAFIGGDFTTARPAGAAVGTNTVSRTGLLSFDITTGALTSWNPAPNARIKTMTLSPDKSTLYVGGNFTSIASSTRYRIAAFNVATGALTSFRPVLNGKVNGVAVTSSTVYAVGGFTTANSLTVTGAASYTIGGTVNTGWNPTIANGQALAVVAKPDNSRVVIGGNFKSVNGSSNPGYGLASLDGATAALEPFAVNNVVRNADNGSGTSNAAISSLAMDADGVYGTGQHYGSGTLEGTFYADWDTGNIRWVEDCHGDSYSVWPVGDVVYTTSHAHYCGNIGGFPQTTPWTSHKALAFTRAATGTIGHDPYGYTDWYGTQSPTLLNWFPDMNDGTFTGLNQSAWSITGNSDYVLYGGEFTVVNNVKQQGIVLFARTGLSTNKDGPRVSGADFVPSVVSLAPGTVRVGWQANWDRDNVALKYEVIRNSASNAPVYTTTLNSTFWQRPSMGFTDTGLTPGATYTYRIRVTDPFGNAVSSTTVSATVTTANLSAYAQKVLDDHPSDFWRLGEASGSKVYDWSGYQDAVAGSGVTRGATGAIGSDSNKASTFSGDGNGLAATQSLIPGPQVFSLEAWFKTTTTTGGKIIGFGNANTGESSNYDRHIYMDGSGRVFFGVHPGASRTVQSAAGLNDGQWHYVVGNLGPTGMQLFVDGKRVAQRVDTTSAQQYSGYWRIGGDSAWGGDNYFDGSIDDVAVYANPLSVQQVNDHWVASGRPSILPSAPSDAYGARVYNDSPDLFWRLGETSGSTAADSGTVGATGNYQGGVTQGVTGAIAGTSNKAAAFNGVDGAVVGSTVVSNPTVYSEEAWFKTSTTTGGKIIGFGSSPTGTSGSYDRHVYMQDDGRLVFGTWTGTANIITTSGTFNNGAWHHVVATQGPSGMALYVDGDLAGTNLQTNAEGYDGYWRVGGDNTWGSTSRFINATIDDVAVYGYVLDTSAVAAHYALGVGQTPNQAPTASFTATPSVLGVSVNASASQDSDGSIASYTWNFGDGTAPVTTTTPNTTHAYTAGGPVTISLVVTDNDGATANASQSVTIASPPVNQAPTASFTSTPNHLDVVFNGAASADADGSIASYAWDFNDGSPVVTGTGTPGSISHSYTAANTYHVSLVVTDDSGATGTLVQDVTVTAAPPVNQAPTASFTSTVTNLSVDLDGSGSSDPDGTVTGYAWSYSDGGSDTIVKPTHVFASAGTYTVTLTVTDSGGATATSTNTVVATAVPNQPPTASFTSTVTNLSVDLDGSGSSDPDGTITGYAWSYSDGGSDTIVKPTHAFASAGTYTVTLTVTDSAGATATSTRTVTATAPTGPAVRAADTFSRSVSNGLGSAETGGAWTLSGSASNFGVNGSQARIRVATAGGTTAAYLNGAASTDADIQTAFSLETPATGTGTYVSVIGRKVGSSDYRAKLRVYPDGKVTLQVTGGSTVVVPGITYATGDTLVIRLQVTGTSPTTVRAKVWRLGDTQPAAWQSTATDSTAGLQAAGSIGYELYVPTSSTTVPVYVRFDDLLATATS